MVVLPVPGFETTMVLSFESMIACCSGVGLISVELLMIFEDYEGFKTDLKNMMIIFNIVDIHLDL